MNEFVVSYLLSYLQIHAIYVPLRYQNYTKMQYLYMVTSGVDINVQRLIIATPEAFKDDKGQRSAGNGDS